MKRFPSQVSPRRPAESDTTVLVLGGLLLILLLVVAGVGGLGVWMWMRATQAREMAEQAMMEARESEMQARMHLEMAREQEVQARAEIERNLQQIRLRPPEEPAPMRPVHAVRLVAAPALGPWPLLPLLPVDGDAIGR